MKKIIGMAALSVLVVSQLSFSAGKSNTDAAVQRLLKVAKQRQAEQAIEVTPVEVTGSTTTGTAPRVKRVNSKKAEIKAMKAKEKNMTESEKMDVEIQKIKKRVTQINNNIDTFNKNNEILEKMEQRLDQIQDKMK